jgi:hypothetical protein
MTQLVGPLLEDVGEGNLSDYFTLGYWVNVMTGAFEDIPTRKRGYGRGPTSSLAQCTPSRVSFLCGTSLCFLLQSV